MKNKDLLKIGMIYTASIITAYGLMLNSAKNTEISKLKTELFEAKKIAVETNQELDSAYEMVLSLNEALDEYEVFNKLNKDLRRVDDELKTLTISVCKTESNLKYKVKHLGKFDKTTTGICGIKKLWIKEIDDITKDNINSLYAGSLVLKYLIDKYDGDTHLALKHFKGAKEDEIQVNKVYTIMERLK